MKVSSSWLRRQMATCLMLVVTASCTELAVAEPFPISPASVPAGAAAGSAATLPDSPTPMLAGADGQQQTSNAQPAQQNQQNNNVPVGTAAAPEVKSLGVPASRPAGAAIAPAKQRRIRSFTIRTALIIGAVVAVGAVAGASLASPSRPK